MLITRNPEIKNLFFFQWGASLCQKNKQEKNPPKAMNLMKGFL